MVTSEEIFPMVKEFARTILRGIGQVMFQNNALSGALMWAGIIINSWEIGLAAFGGTLISTLTASVLKYPKEAIQDGLYGFNGALTGIAILFFFEASFTTIVALLVASALSSILMHFMKRIIPPFTAPFVLVTWLVMFLFLFVSEFSLLPAPDLSAPAMDYFSAAFHSFGQVMFQENVVTGVFFLLAILVNSRLMALYAIYASILGSFTGLLFSEYTTVNAGLMGYNAILCAIALTGKSWTDFLWISLAVVLSTLVNTAMGTTGMITLTAPFVLVTWGVLMAKKLLTPSQSLP